VKTPKVRLYIRIRRSDETVAFVDPAWNRNRTLREGYALIDGQSEHHVEGVYYLRFLRDGKRVWQAVGSDANNAIVALRNTEHDLQSIALGRSVPTSSVVSTSVEQLQAVISLNAAIQEYLDEVRRFRSPKTIAACENMLSRFSAGLPGKLIKDITRKNLLDHMSTLKEEGLGDRTIFNHINRINTLLKTTGVTNLLGVADKPKFDEKDVTAYNSDELAALFAAANAEERHLFEFFLGIRSSTPNDHRPALGEARPGSSVSVGATVFSNASHQVIILSTDSEIDAAFIPLLGESIARSYELWFDIATQSIRLPSAFCSAKRIAPQSLSMPCRISRSRSAFRPIV
jgi:hypothetical protein